MKALRIVLALLNLLALAALFLDPTGFATHYCTFLARIQFLPAVLSMNLVLVLALLALTLLCGRTYCRVICPLGVSQDLMRGFTAPRRVCTRLPESHTQTIVRHVILSVTVLLGAAGLGFVWLDPYAIFARALALGGGAAPMCWCSRLLAVLPFAIILLLSLLGRNRWWCNWVCPVGTILAMVARWTRHPDKMNDSACRHCRRCCPTKEAL